MQIFKTLATLQYERQYISDALFKGGVNIGEDYWRLRLAMFVLLVNDLNELPAPLRKNFCPLFWFTNFLVITAPIWGMIYFLVWLSKVIYQGPVEKTLDAVISVKERREKIRTEVRERMNAEKRKSRVFDERKVIYRDLSWGHTFIGDYLETLVHRKVIPSATDVDWNSPALLDGVFDDDITYYIKFRRQYGDLWAEKLAEFRAADDAAKTKKAEEEQRKAVLDRKNEEEFRQILTGVFSWSKAFCKAILIVVSVPAILALAWLVYHAVILVGECAVFVLHLLFIKYLLTTVTVVGVVFLLVLAVFAIANFLSEKDLSPIVDGLHDGIVACFGPFKWLGKKVAGFFTFILMFIKMFFSENCPGIEIIKTTNTEPAEESA